MPHVASNSESHGPPPGVAWFAGDVAEAFAEAARQRKPVFVYFGAVWCPPCLELKATLFKRQDFLERLQSFVPVYVDGDAPDAQRWMSEFHAMAYPTALILRSDRSEIDRVSGGMNLDRYAQVLDTGLKAVRPLSQIIAALDSGNAPLSLDDCRVMAFNSWQLDPSWDSADPKSHWLESTATALERASERCPKDARLERARLQMVGAYAAVTARAASIKSGEAGKVSLGRQVERVRSIVTDQTLADGMGDVLIDMPAELLGAVDKIDAPHAREFRDAYFQAMTRLENDTRYSGAVRLYATSQKVVVSKGEGEHATVSADVAADAHRRINEAMQHVQSGPEHASIVNSVEAVLDALADKDGLSTLLHDEIKTSPTPYYYMGDLAELEEERGHKDQAIDWFARAYRESRGGATRLQWGSHYVNALIRLRPDDDAAIRAAAIQLIGEARDTDGLYARSRRSLSSVADKLHTWNSGDKHRAAVVEIRKSLSEKCENPALADASRAACQDVLSRI
ncbi:MAG TPA: thioredoxin family protein [Steroidobacteraceae bacterium]|jgi:thiol-disulfide isomerase/thioredoxin